MSLQTCSCRTCKVTSATFLFVSCHVPFETTALRAWVVTAATLIRLLPSVGVGMGLQTIKCCTWVVTASTLEKLLTSVSVGMGLESTSCSTWVVTATTFIRLLPAVDHLVSLQTACLESGVSAQVTFPHTRGLIHSIFDPHFFGLWCELVNLTEYV